MSDYERLLPDSDTDFADGNEIIADVEAAAAANSIESGSGMRYDSANTKWVPCSGTNRPRAIITQDVASNAGKVRRRLGLPGSKLYVRVNEAVAKGQGGVLLGGTRSSSNIAERFKVAADGDVAIVTFLDDGAAGDIVYSQFNV